MKAELPLIILLFSASALSKAEPKSDIYQVTLRADQSDMHMFTCINDECQKSLNHKKSKNEYIYDFGTFPIPEIQDIDLRVWKHDLEKRRVQRAREHYAPSTCNISSCGSFGFINVNTPTTSTTDTCELGLSCDRGGLGLR